MSKAYEVITDRIIAALEQGIVPWRRPWKSSTNVPRSMSTGKPYRGINVLMLAMTAQAKGYSSPYWLTFKQAKALGGCVRKGEKATPVVLWKWIETTDKDTGEPKRIPFLRYFSVFNVEQCDDVPAPTLEEQREHQAADTAEDIVQRYCDNGGPTLQHGGDMAYYSPADDVVRVPHPEQFTSGERYYSTLFHELGHSTGHESRLARPFGRFGSGPYSREELVAEITACFLMSDAELEIQLEQSASYIDNWLSALQNDKQLVVMAAAAAQKAADLIQGRQPVEQSNPEPAAVAA